MIRRKKKILKEKRRSNKLKSRNMTENHLIGK